MRIALILAASALLAIGAAPTTSNAQQLNPPPTDRVCNSDHVCSPGGPNGGGTGCAAICGVPEVAKNSAIKDCSDHLAALPHITKRDIVEIGMEQRLHLSPVCENYADQDLTAKQVHYLERGNVAGLELAIEANPLLMQELSDHHYKVGDVLGLLIGDNAAVLYVHKM
jgi:hypothetical protein